MSYLPYPINRELNTDAAGRTRVSGLTTLFDGKTLNSDDPISWQNVGTGTTTFSNNKVSLSVTAGQYMIRRGRRYIPYFSGKSQIIETTFDGFDTVSGVEERVGYFSSNAVAPYNSNLDGFFLSNNAGSISLQVHRKGTQTANIPFTSWDNYAKLQSYDWSKFTVVVYDYLWLGGTELRIWIKTSEGFVLAHTFKWASINTDTFIFSPNQSIRYEIRSSTGVGSLRTICSAVATEGDPSSTSKSISIFTPSAINANTVGTIYAIKSIRKAASHRDIAVMIEGISVVNTSVSDAGVIMLIINPTLSAPITYTNRTRFEEGQPTNQTITAGTGTVIWSGPSAATGSVDGLDANFYSAIANGIDDTSDELVLAYMSATANQSVFGIINARVA